MKEIWKDIPEYEGYYQISNLGRIKSLHNYRGKESIIKPRIKQEYLTIGLRKNNVRKWKRIHRLIAEAFIPNPNNYPVVNHKNENKLDNRIENLEWCTVGYNNTYGSRLKRVKQKVSKPVIQYDLQGNYIKEFESIGDAAREINTNAGNIIKCCKRNPKYNKVKGYVWRYKSEVMPYVDGKCVLL